MRTMIFVVILLLASVAFGQPVATTVGANLRIDGTAGDDNWEWDQLPFGQMVWRVGSSGPWQILTFSDGSHVFPGQYSQVSWHLGGGDDRFIQHHAYPFSLVWGDDGNDYLENRADALSGAAGSGSFLAMSGGAGNDIIDGGFAKVITLALHGNAGNDSLRVAERSEHNYLYGGAGDDSITGGRPFRIPFGTMTAYGNEGNDFLQGLFDGSNTLEGGPGADSIWTVGPETASAVPNKVDEIIWRTGDGIDEHNFSFGLVDMGGPQDVLIAQETYFRFIGEDNGAAAPLESISISFQQPEAFPQLVNPTILDYGQVLDFSAWTGDFTFPNQNSSETCPGLRGVGIETEVNDNFVLCVDPKWDLDGTFVPVPEPRFACWLLLLGVFRCWRS